MLGDAGCECGLTCCGTVLVVLLDLSQGGLRRGRDGVTLQHQLPLPPGPRIGQAQRMRSPRNLDDAQTRQRRGPGALGRGARVPSVRAPARAVGVRAPPVRAGPRRPPPSSDRAEAAAAAAAPPRCCCDTRSRLASDLADRRADFVGGVVPGQCSLARARSDVRRW